jgi:hypothetical protein
VDENRIVYDRLQPAKNYTDNPEALLRKSWSRTASSSATVLASEPVTLTPSATTTMTKSLRDYSTPTIANVPVGPTINMGTRNFELCNGLITMVQANQFYGLPSEDTSAYLQHFLELCETIIIKDITPASIRLRLFPFSLAGKAKQWFYKKKRSCRYMGQMFGGVPREIFPHGQNQ